MCLCVCAGEEITFREGRTLKDNNNAKGSEDWGWNSRRQGKVLVGEGSP